MRRARTCSTRPIEELDLPMRAYNSLKRNSITKIGQVLSLSTTSSCGCGNFGQKSLDELKERLALRGFISPEAHLDEHRRVGPAGRRRSSTRRPPQSSTARRRPMPHRIAGRKLGRTQRPSAADARQPGGVGDPLRAGRDHRGEGQGGPGSVDGMITSPSAATCTRARAGSADAARAAHRRQADGRDRHKYADRSSGFTRIIKIGQRLGDAAPIVQIELV
jgi:hypothetical protein